MKSVFVSHDYEDVRWSKPIKKWASKGRFGPLVTVISETEDMRTKGATAIKAHLSPKLRGMSVILVLVGDSTHNRPWVDYEVQYALSHHKAIIGVRVPNTHGAPPQALRERPLVAFNPNAIIKHLL